MIHTINFIDLENLLLGKSFLAYFGVLRCLIPHRGLRYLLWLLLPLGIIHLLIVSIRNRLYDWKILKTKRLPRPVISIGNLQLGGTGKTPLTITILNKLQSKGLKVGVLSRGYKRKSGDEIIVPGGDRDNHEDHYASIGDEPVLILKHLKEGALGVGQKRYRVGVKMLEAHPVDVFLLDDGLQHRRLHREMDICLIDVTRWKNHPFLFPFSNLRDSKSSLKRCHSVILTKIGDKRDKAEELKRRIQRKYGIAVFEGDLQPQALINIRDGAEVSLAKLTGHKAAAFCGIADPDYFFYMLKQNGALLVFEKKFPDHYHYSLGDLGELRRAMSEKGLNTAFTTEKDAVKLGRLMEKDEFEGVRFFFLKVGFVIRNEDEFLGLISNFLPHKYFEGY